MQERGHTLFVIGGLHNDVLHLRFDFQGIGQRERGGFVQHALAEALVGPSANWRAKASTVESSFSAGTTWFTNPNPSASSAFTFRPVAISSNAFAGPTNRHHHFFLLPF